MAVESIQWADGYLLVYSILDRSSFDYIRRCKDLITEVRGASVGGINSICTPVPLVLLANKADMVHLRQVTSEEGTYYLHVFSRVSLYYRASYVMRLKHRPRI